MTVYQLTLRTLSPVHIGEGHELRQDFDFVVHGNNTYRLNEDALLAQKEERLVPDRTGHYPAPGHLLDESDFRNSSLFRYRLPGRPRSRRTDARVQSCIKDVFDRPYIPGSSLKGALRTALAWSGWEEVNPPLERSSFQRSKNWAGQSLESKLFRPGSPSKQKDPNYDLLRALHVSDLFGPQKPGQGLQLVNAQVLTRRSTGSPIELEALTGDLTFQGSLTIDDTLFAPQMEKELQFAGRRHWLDQLMVRVQAFSQARIEKLVDWFSKAENAERIAVFYRQLAQFQMRPNAALLQLGWGSGWDGKTFWSHLQKDADFFEYIINKYSLHRAGRNSPRRQPGDPFPRSRRVITGSKGPDSVPLAPFGWVFLEMKQQ